MNPITPKSTDFVIANPLTSDANIQTKIQIRPEETVGHYWLYALRLEDSKYYVGSTAKRNPYDRIQQHIDSKGARWAKLHKPLALLEIRDIGYVTKAQAVDLEHELTLVYMRLFGYKKVRGGYIVPSGSIVNIFDRFIWGKRLRNIAIISTGLCILAAWIIYSILKNI